MILSNVSSQPAVPDGTPRGVFDADPLHPPIPPMGARAVAIKDDAGTVITYAWVHPAYAGDELDAQAWTWLELCEQVKRRHATHIKLVL